MNQKVSENFIILALNPKSGNYMVIGNYLNYGLLGAVMMDLALGGRISIEGKKISPDPSKGITGITVHDRMYEQFLKSPSPKKISAWIRRLSFNARWYLREMRNFLVNNGTLRKERKRFLFIPYSLHYVSDINRRMKLVLRLKEIILYSREPDEAESMLLGLIYACKLHRALSDNYEERRNIRKRLVKYMKESPVASGVNQSVMEIQAAISASIAASVAATSAASH